jgi:hypothetical protein
MTRRGRSAVPELSGRRRAAMPPILSNHDVMRGLVPRIHVVLSGQGVNRRDKPGHDAVASPASSAEKIRVGRSIGCTVAL